MEGRNGKAYIYYVATFNHWTIVDADRAREAIDLAENDPILQGRPILVVRIATKDEVEQFEHHASMLKKEKSA